MSDVRDQYEAFPYPARDPADEAKRLIEGSPSNPMEVDHFVFGGARDWSQPMRVLFAGGGTGDGLIMFATKCQEKGYPVDIHYLDVSVASRKTAEERANVRNLENITFHTGDLMTAPKFGPFDYIDCCGVLHHLPKPIDGFKALRSALSDEGGLGLMVYAPFGRTGVYPLQAAFRTLFADKAQGDVLSAAKDIVAVLPEVHEFKRNPMVQDHISGGDAGFVDLLLHSQDRAFTVTDLSDALSEADLDIVGFVEPALYQPETYLPKSVDVSEALDRLNLIERAQLAEQLHGGLKGHTVYACPKGCDPQPVSPSNLKLVPHLKGIQPGKLAKQISTKGQFRVTLSGIKMSIVLPKACAVPLSYMDGRNLSDIARASQIPALDFIKVWRPIHNRLTDLNILNYSSGFDL